MERTLFLNGTIAEESWFDDDVTPQLFKEELNAGTGNILSLIHICTRVELVEMDDFQAPPIGTKGTVEGVDDTVSLLVAWDNGSRLNVVYGEDEVRKI